MAPWKGPRHRSWAADRHVATLAFAIIFVTYLVFEIVDEAPQGLTSLLGVAGGIWFGAVSADKAKRDKEVEQKVDRLERVAEYEHGDVMNTLDDNAEHDKGEPRP